MSTPAVKNSKGRSPDRRKMTLWEAGYTKGIKRLERANMLVNIDCLKQY